MKRLSSAKLTFIPVFIIVIMVLSAITGCNPREEDLTGGMELIMKVDTREAVMMQTRQFRKYLVERMKDAGISFSGTAVKESDTIEISGLNEQDKEKIKEILDDVPGQWDHKFVEAGLVLTLKPDTAKKIEEQAVLQTLEVIKKRLDIHGLNKEYAEIETPGSNLLKVRIPPRVDSRRIIALFRMRGILEFLPVVVDTPFPTEEEALNVYNGTLPDEIKILKGDPRGGAKGYYIVNAAPVITGQHIEIARQIKDQFGAPSVSASLNTVGGRIFQTYTAANIGKRLAIVLDNRVITAPVIQDIISKDLVVTGNFTIVEAEDLALVLRSGGLPVTVNLIEERIIGKEEK